MESSLILRTATPQDAAALLEIYAPYVRETAITFEYEVPSVQEFAERIAATLEKYPYIIAVQNGRICAYAYAGPFKARAAYQHSVETSIYVDASARELGIGTLLYAVLEEILLAQNVFNLNACIAVPAVENDPYLTNGSLLFHEKQGYALVGRFCGCAFKFNRWYDMVWMEKLQGDQAERLCRFKQLAQTSDVPAFVSFPHLDQERVRNMLLRALWKG